MKRKDPLDEIFVKPKYETLVKRNSEKNDEIKELKLELKDLHSTFNNYNKYFEKTDRRIKLLGYISFENLVKDFVKNRDRLFSVEKRCKVLRMNNDLIKKNKPASFKDNLKDRINNIIRQNGHQSEGIYGGWLGIAETILQTKQTLSTGSESGGKTHG